MAIDSEDGSDGMGLLELDKKISHVQDLQIWEQKERLKHLSFQSV